MNLAALDDFLTSWWRIAARAAQDREDRQRMHDEAEQIRSGQRSSGTPPAEILARRPPQPPSCRRASSSIIVVKRASRSPSARRAV
ncbi:DUF6247 family protein [Streptosporangium roseum]|uniref:DUF6247 family protein n=1 Tax=Streptosporangium roseum TaxID=2001 RepID=UPI003AFAA9B5